MAFGRGGGSKEEEEGGGISSFFWSRRWKMGVLRSSGVAKLANVVVVYVDGVKLVAVQDEGFARALCLNSEEVREQVGRVEVRGGRLFGFR